VTQGEAMSSLTDIRSSGDSHSMAWITSAAARGTVSGISNLRVAEGGRLGESARQRRRRRVWSVTHARTVQRARGGEVPCACQLRLVERPTTVVRVHTGVLCGAVFPTCSW
jgi:hypothetical protein